MYQPKQKGGGRSSRAKNLPNSILGGPHLAPKVNSESCYAPEANQGERGSIKRDLTSRSMHSCLGGEKNNP